MNVPKCEKVTERPEIISLHVRQIGQKNYLKTEKSQNELFARRLVQFFEGANVMYELKKGI